LVDIWVSLAVLGAYGLLAAWALGNNQCGYLVILLLSSQHIMLLSTFNMGFNSCIWCKAYVSQLMQKTNLCDYLIIS
jgi:hypothetical protein